MTDIPQDSSGPASQPSTDAVELENLVRSLRRKEGGWVHWGQACTALQKATWQSVSIFGDLDDKDFAFGDN